MRTQLIFSILLLSIAFPGSLWAEFYRYTGEDGAIHFTDDLSQVPLDQREQVEAYTGTQTPPPAPEPAEVPKAQKAANLAKEAIANLEEQRQSLVTRQETLKTEYERLMNVKAETEVLRQTADTPEKQQALKDKLTALQADITKYDTQTKALEEEVNAFNEAIKNNKAVKAGSPGEAPKP